MWWLIPDSCDHSARTRRRNPMALDDSDFQIHSGHTLAKSRHHLEVKVGPCPNNEVLVPGASLCNPPWVLPCLSILPGRTQRSFLLLAICKTSIHKIQSTFIFAYTDTKDFSTGGAGLIHERTIWERDIICKMFLVKFTWFSGFRHSNAFPCISGT